MHLNFTDRRILIVLMLSIVFIISSCDDSSEKDSPKAETTHNIYTAEDLYAIGRGLSGYTGWLLGHEYILMDDIDLTDYQSGLGFQPIGYVSVDEYEPFTGIFNGNGYTISNLTINNNIVGITGPDVTGLFFEIKGGTVKHLSLEDVDIQGGNYTGALAGRNSGTVENCSVSGSVQGSDNVGGIVGYNEGGTMSHCTSTATVAGYSIVGGITGYSMNGEFSGCQTGGTIVIENTYSIELVYTGGIIGYSTKNDIITDCHSTVSINGTGSYVGGLIGRLNESTVSNCSASGNISVNADNGLGGLVGCADNLSSISDSYAAGNVVNPDSEKLMENFYGGLVGDNGAVITRCYALGNVAGNMAEMGSYCVGGLVGLNKGTISQCYASGDVEGYSQVGGLIGCSQENITDCYATGSVAGNGIVGGLIGDNEQCVTNCYSIGNVAHSEYSGGLIGKSSIYLVTRSYYNSETTGHTTSPDSTYYGEPRTTIQLKTESTFTSGSGPWDFDDIWDFDLLINDGYPHLVIFDD